MSRLVFRFGLFRCLCVCCILCMHSVNDERTCRTLSPTVCVANVCMETPLWVCCTFRCIGGLVYCVCVSMCFAAGGVSSPFIISHSVSFRFGHPSLAYRSMRRFPLCSMRLNNSLGFFIEWFAYQHVK